MALRTMTAMRVEEGVLVALADRRRALAGRTLGGGGGSDGSGGGRVNGVGVSAAADAATAGDWIRLSTDEEAEVVYRRAWLCFIWLRARPSSPHSITSLIRRSTPRLRELCFTPGWCIIGHDQWVVRGRL